MHHPGRIKTTALAFALAATSALQAQTEIEPNNTYTTATAVAYNTAMSGSTGACSPADNSLDYFSINPTSQGVLRVRTTMSNTGTAPISVTFQVRSSSTAVLGTYTVTAGANGVPVNDSFLFPCRGVGTYYISIPNPGSSVCTNYSFTYDIIDPAFANDAEPNDTYTSALTVPVNTWSQGQVNFHYGDNADWYRLDLPTQGVLHIEWEAEHADASPGTATISLRQTSTSVIQNWDVPVGANSAVATGAVSIDCRSNTNHYLINVASAECGTSYRFRYTVTAPVFANDVEPNDAYTQAIALPHSTPTEGHINFSTYVENSDYYRLDLPTQGVLNIHWQAEHAGAGEGTATIRLRSSSTSLIETWTMPVGGGSEPESRTVSIPCRSNTGHYYLDVVGETCGISYRFSYTVTPPVFANDTEPNDTYTQAIVLPHSTPTEGQINFSTYVENSDYYRLDLPSNGVLHVQWEAEHAGMDPGTATIRLRNTSTAVLQEWTMPVGANSAAVSHVVSMDCQGDGNHYYLDVVGVSCGISYRLSYSVTAPVFGIAPVAGTTYTSAAPMVNSDSSSVQGQLNFHYGPTNAYYRVQHAGGPLVLLLQAEHAGGDPADYSIRLRSASTAVLQTETRSAGAGGTPQSATVDFGTRAAAIYYVELSGGPCGMSFAINCNDSDGDGVCNYFDLCPGGPEPGTPCNDGDLCTVNDVIGTNCGCAGTLQDTDDDGACDANDGCPFDPLKTAPGHCGCGNPEPGAICDDNNTNTVGDVVTDACECAGTPIVTYDCPALQANIGDACNDNNASTENDVINDDCECVGTPIVTYDCPALQANIGDACNDDNAATESDAINHSCECVGTPIVTYDCEELQANIGDACNDNNASTENDVINASCECVGTPIVTYDCEELQANIGDTCNDNNASTENDVINASCVCVGTPIVTYDCEELQANIGDACNDDNASTENDVVTEDCSCIGTPTGCTENLQLTITLDAFGAQTTWQLRDDLGNTITSGGPYLNGQSGTLTEELCVPQGCYSLIVNDAAGNGITAGGYVLAYADGRRIVDANGLFSSTSQVRLQGAPMPFCLPLGSSHMLAGTCDKPARAINLPVYASNYGATASQYQFWIFDPHGSYSRRVATTNPQFTPGDLNTSPVPVNTALNICVRVMVDGSYRPFGPVCRYFFTPRANTANSLAPEAAEAIALFPNPNRTGIVNLAFTDLRSEGLPIAIDLYDATGKRVHVEQIHAKDRTFTHLLQLGNNLSAGIYLVQVTVDGQRHTKRLVLE